MPLMILSDIEGSHESYTVKIQQTSSQFFVTPFCEFMPLIEIANLLDVKKAMNLTRFENFCNMRPPNFFVTPIREFMPLVDFGSCRKQL